MIDFLISLLFAGLGFGGALLTFSGMLNSYMKKKLEYMAYRNQTAANNILSDFNSRGIEDEAAYYRAHGLAGNVVDINFTSGLNLKGDLLKPKTYLNFLIAQTTHVQKFLTELDYGLLFNQIKIKSIKIFKYLTRQYQELAAFLVKITQPINPQDLESERSAYRPSRSTQALSNKIKKLNSRVQALTWQNFGGGSNQPEISPESTPPAQNNSTSFTNNPQSEDTELEIEMYEKMETALLNKLNDNVSDLEIWKDLGNFYKKYGEDSKALEIFAYIDKHQNKHQVSPKTNYHQNNQARQPEMQV